jgi:hypothetical protein
MGSVDSCGWLRDRERYLDRRECGRLEDNHSHLWHIELGKPADAARGEGNVLPVDPEEWGARIAMFCKETSPALKRYQRRVTTVMVAYVVILLSASWLVKHGHPHGWHLYFWSSLPAIPVIMVIVAMGRYISEEKDEYLRLRTMLALLVATGALLGTLVVSDFLQAFAKAPAFPPFTSFVIFCAAFAITQGVLKLRDRASDD